MRALLSRNHRSVHVLSWCVAMGALVWLVMTPLATLVNAAYEPDLRAIALSTPFGEAPETPDSVLVSLALTVVGLLGRIVALGSLAILLASRALQAASAYRARLLEPGPADSSSR